MTLEALRAGRVSDAESNDYVNVYLRVFGEDPCKKWAECQNGKQFKKLSIFQPAEMTYSTQTQAR